MTKWIGAAVLALTLMLGGSAAINPAAAAPLQVAVQKPESLQATDLSARRRYRHYDRYGYRSDLGRGGNHRPRSLPYGPVLPQRAPSSRESDSKSNQ